jgi:hypothetical protein
MALQPLNTDVRYVSKCAELAQAERTIGELRKQLHTEALMR